MPDLVMASTVTAYIFMAYIVMARYVKTMRRGLNSTRSFIEAYSNAAVTFQRRRDLTTAMAV